MTEAELHALAKDNMGKAAYEFWLEHMSGLPAFLNQGQVPAWEDFTPGGKQDWIDLCEAESSAFLQTYADHGDSVECSHAGGS